jgi:hypothetical protein
MIVTEHTGVAFSSTYYKQPHSLKAKQIKAYKREEKCT